MGLLLHFAMIFMELALTILINGYMGCLSIFFLDFKNKKGNKIRYDIVASGKTRHPTSFHLGFIMQSKMVSHVQK